MYNSGLDNAGFANRIRYRKFPGIEIPIDEFNRHRLICRINIIMATQSNIGTEFYNIYIYAYKRIGCLFGVENILLS